MDPILVTGGTGTLGQHVVRRLREQSLDVRILSRRHHENEGGVSYMKGDLLNNEGIDAAVTGVSTIIHCAGAPKGDEIATLNLVEAARRAGSPHIVYISVVGAERLPVKSRVDRMMFSYFAMKRQAEEIVISSGLPWTILRATQFHDLILTVVGGMSKLPVMPVPNGVSFQPVDSDEVAARMVELAMGRPAGLVPDMAGPRVYAFKSLVRGYLDGTQRHRLIVPMPMVGKAAKALRAGANLAPEHAVGKMTWERFLQERLKQPALVR